MHAKLHNPFNRMFQISETHRYWVLFCILSNLKSNFEKLNASFVLFKSSLSLQVTAMIIKNVSALIKNWKAVTLNVWAMLFAKCIVNLIRKPEPDTVEVIMAGIAYAPIMTKKMNFALSNLIFQMLVNFWDILCFSWKFKIDFDSIIGIKFHKTTHTRYNVLLLSSSLYFWCQCDFYP